MATKPWERGYAAAEEDSSAKPWERGYASEDADKTAAQLGAEQAWDEMPWYQQVGVGFAKPIADTYYGIKNLAGQATEDERRMADSEAGQAIGGLTGTGGKILGEVAMFAGGGGAGGLVGRGLARGAARAAGTRLPRAMALAGRAAPAAGVIGGEGAVGGLQAEGQDREFGEGFSEGAAGAAVGMGVGNVLGRAVQRIQRPLRAANRVSAEQVAAGVPLTPGQYANGATRWVEDRMSALPLIGPQIKARQADAFNEWNKQLLQKVTNLVDGPAIKAAGNGGFEEVGQVFSKAYDALDEMRLPLNDEIAQSILSLAGKRGSADYVGKAAVDESLQFLSKRSTEGFDVMSGAGYRGLRKQLKAALKTARRENDEIGEDVIGELLDGIKTLAPKDFLARLDAADRGYGQLETLRRAGTYKGASEAEGVFTPGELMQAVRGRGGRAGRRAVAEGRAPLQREATEAASTFGASKPGILEPTINPLVAAGSFLAAPGSTTTAMALAPAAYTKPGVKYLTGQNKWQKSEELAGVLEELRGWLTYGGAGVGSIDTGDDE